jgi:Flp pilus assembly pilin Flp
LHTAVVHRVDDVPDCEFFIYLTPIATLRYGHHHLFHGATMNLFIRLLSFIEASQDFTLLRRLPRFLRQRQRGQATTEYALILLVAAIVAIGVITWATAGGGAGKIGSLFDSILDTVLSRAESTF